MIHHPYNRCTFRVRYPVENVIDLIRVTDFNRYLMRRRQGVQCEGVMKLLSDKLIKYFPLGLDLGKPH